MVDATGRAIGFSKASVRSGTSKVGRIGELGNAGFPAAEKTLSKLTPPGRTPRMYIGNNTRGLYYTAIERGQITYGRLNHPLEKMLPEIKGAKRVEVILEPRAIDAGLVTNKLLKPGVKISVSKGDGNTWPTRIRYGDSPGISVEFNRSKLIQVKDSVVFSHVSKFNNWPFDRDKIRLLLHFHKYSDLEKAKELEKMALDSGLELITGTAETILDEIEQHPERLIILLGNVEQHSFVTYGANGVRHREIPLEKLEELAEGRDRPIISLGYSAAQPTNPDHNINTIQRPEIIRRLKQALNSESMADFYSAFGTPAVPIVVNELEIEEKYKILEGQVALPDRSDDGKHDTLQIRVMKLPGPMFFLSQLLGAFAFWVVVHLIQRSRSVFVRQNAR